MNLFRIGRDKHTKEKEKKKGWWRQRYHGTESPRHESWKRETAGGNMIVLLFNALITSLLLLCNYLEIPTLNMTHPHKLCVERMHKYYTITCIFHINNVIINTNYHSYKCWLSMKDRRFFNVSFQYRNWQSTLRSWKTCV